MPVAKAEQRLPEGFQATDLGQAAISPDGHIVLVSYNASPVAQGRSQDYVVFILDATLRSQVNSFQWQVLSTDVTTLEGVWQFTPTQVGSMTLNVTVRNAANAAVGTISLTQTVTQPNEDLENLVNQANATHPVAGDPSTSREIINDFLGDIHAVAPIGSAAALNNLLFGITYVEAQAVNRATRHRTLNTLRTAVNAGQAQAASFLTTAAAGAGICNLRPEILAMTLQHGGSPLIPWRDIPHVAAQRSTTLATLQTALAALPEDRRIDIFNVLRFPRASLKACQMILDQLRSRYFSNHTLSAILGNNTRAQQLIFQLKTGPFSMTPPLPTINNFPSRVIGRMVSTLWFQIGRNAPPGGGAIGGLGNIPAPPTLFGNPEHVPEETYVVQALADDNGFITSANNYHRIYGLNPTTIRSLEHLLDLVDNRTTHLARLRIVGHVGVDATATGANLNVAFFENGERIVTEEMLRGFGESDEKGLWAIIDHRNYANPTSPSFPDLVSNIIYGLRATNRAVLIPFGLHASTHHTGDLSLFLYAASDLLFSTLMGVDTDYAILTLNGTNLTNAQRGHLNTSLGHILDGIRTRLSGSTIGTTTITDAHVNALRAAIVGLSPFELRAPNPIFISYASNILSHLRSNNTSVLIPFGLHQIGTPSGDLQNFFLACSDKLFAKLVLASPAVGSITLNGSNLSTAQRALLNASLDRVINHFQGLLVGTTFGSTTITAAHMNALKTAIASLTVANLGMGTLGNAQLVGFGSSNFTTTSGLDPMSLLGEANAAIGRNFRQKINAVKARLDKNSWVDIRGCRIGQVRTYLQALQVFFGRTNDLPFVTGPRWFQSFPVAGWEPLGTQDNVDTLWLSGNPGGGHSAAEIQAAFAKCSRYAGTGSHITFWAGVAALDNFRFAAMLWKGSLPPLPIQASRLANFDTLDLSDAIARVATIFDISTTPSNATFTRIEARHAQIVALQSEINTIAGMGPAPSTTMLNQSFTRLQQINTQLGLTVVPATVPSPLNSAHLVTYTNRLKAFFEIVTIPNGPANLFNVHVQVDELAAQLSPPAAELTARFNDLLSLQTTIGAAGIVPATAPTSLTAATLQGYITQMIAHLNTSADLVTFKNAVHTQTQHTRAEFRYYFFVGLALLVDEANNFFFYTLNAPRDEAMRSFMRAHWQGVLPSGNRTATTNHNSNDARQISMLTGTGAGSDIGINPYEEFANNLITENGTP